MIYPEFTQSGRFARGIKFPSSAPRPFGSFLSPYENAGLLRPFPVNYGFFLPKIYPMATYYKTGETWRAQVARRGIRKSASGFKTKAAAVAWAGRVEAEIMAGIRGEVPHLPFSVLLQRYATEVSPKKKGERWEVVRLQALERDPLASVSLRRLGAPHVAEWRDRRLQSVSAASVRREWNLLSNVCAIAVREWRLLQSNPFKDLARPKSSQPRNRIATDEELDMLTKSASVNMRRVIMFAVETGMRAGEIASLKPEDIRGAVATLNDTKNGTSREVPLSKGALEQLPAPFGLTAESISALFAQLCKRCEIEGLTFHDLRHLAATRLSKKLNTLQLCRMFGWKDPKQAMTYYNETAAEVAEKL